MILLRIFALAIVVLLLVPVALLPIGTAVPKSILVVFAVVEIALLAVLFRSVRARRILLTLAGFVAIAFSPSLAPRFLPLPPLFSMPMTNPFPTALLCWNR